MEVGISDVPLTQPGNGPEGTAAWRMSASRRKAHFKFWVIGRASSGQLFLIKGRGTRVLVLSRCEEPGGDCNEQKSHSPA